MWKITSFQIQKQNWQHLTHTIALILQGWKNFTLPSKLSTISTALVDRFWPGKLLACTVQGPPRKLTQRNWYPFTECRSSSMSLTNPPGIFQLEHNCGCDLLRELLSAYQRKSLQCTQWFWGVLCSFSITTLLQFLLHCLKTNSFNSSKCHDNMNNFNSL